MDRKEARRMAQALLQRMTTEEKVAQMVQVSRAHVSREEALSWARRGAGSFLFALGEDAGELQRAAKESRLGIPLLFGIDAIHGHCVNPNGTVFPSQLACACAWNPALVKEMGEVTAREVATEGLHWTFSPVLCLGRDTRWGRVDETFGEDPYLAGEMGAAIVKGYQGDDLSDDEHILACAKHYLGYGEATGARDSYDTEVAERKVREVFLPVFKKAVDAGCATIMTAYGSVDGTPLTANRLYLHDILRDEMGFEGFVVTDWDNVNSLVRNQHVAKDVEEASVKAAHAGNDMIMVSLAFYEAMLRALQNGTADIADVDEAVTHILTIKYEMGLFDKPKKTGRPGSIGCKAHGEAALKAARETMTLLKNNGMLPLSNGIKKLAVIGPNADDLPAQYGDWTYFTHPLPKPDHPRMRPYVTLKEGLEALCAERKIDLVYEKGCSVLPDEGDDLDAAVEAARGADAIILAVGDRAELFGEFRDRADLSLSGKQEELFLRLKQLGAPICTVFISSKPLCLGRVAEESDALLCMFNGGMFGGQAAAEAIFGLINPKGRLPISFPRHSGQLPVYYNHLPGWHGGKYCDLPAEPLFSFGEGMGYCNFRYEELRIDEKLLLSVKVTNTGKRTGCETVQVYLRDEEASVLQPVKRLIAFKQVDLAAGETKRVEIPLSKESFSLIDASCQTTLEPGTFTIFAGHSSKDEDLLSVRIEL